MGAEQLIVGVTTVVVTALALVAVRPVLARRNVLDVPGHRSAHSVPTLRGAGIGVTAGVTVAAATAATIMTSREHRVGLLLAAAAVLATAALGAREDVSGLSVARRLALQAGIGVSGSVALLAWSGTSLWLCLPLTLWVVGYVNVTNFMDGVNGISGVHGLVTGLYFLLLGARDGGAPALAVLGLVTAVAFTTWLPWNLGGRRMFLGDAGSYLLGALVAFSAILAVVSGAPLWATFAPGAVYIADTGWTLARRALRGERWYEAHRSHVYQKLVDIGWSHVGVAILVGAATALCGGAALVALHDPSQSPWSVALTVLVLAGYLAAPRLLGRSADRDARRHAERTPHGEV